MKIPVADHGKVGGKFKLERGDVLEKIIETLGGGVPEKMEMATQVTLSRAQRFFVLRLAELYELLTFAYRRNDHCRSERDYLIHRVADFSRVKHYTDYCVCPEPRSVL